MILRDNEVIKNEIKNFSLVHSVDGKFQWTTTSTAKELLLIGANPRLVQEGVKFPSHKPMKRLTCIGKYAAAPPVLIMAY